MPDIVDRSDQDSELHLSLAIKKRKPTLQPTGRCRYCNEPDIPGVFCDAECRDDYERLQRMK